MQYSNWINFLSSTRPELFLTSQQFASLPIGETKKFVPIDYIDFLSNEWPIKRGIEHDKPYFASFLSKFSVEVIRKPNGEVSLTDPQEEWSVEDANWRSDEEGRMVTGSGDGYTRYISLDDLEGIPTFFFPRPENDDGLTFEEEILERQRINNQMEREKFMRQGTDEEKELISSHTDTELCRMIYGGKNLASFKHLVRSIIRKRKGLSNDVSDSEDEYGLQLDREEEQKELERYESEKTEILANGTPKEKELAMRPREELIDLFDGFFPVSLKRMIEEILEKNIC